jgi:hypothetical protein
MDNKLDIPKLQDLDRAGQDYASKLDDGLEKLYAVIVERQKSTFAECRKMGDEAIKSLNGIEGVVAQRLSNVENLSESYSPGYPHYDDEIVIEYKGKRKDKEVNEILRNHARSLEDHLNSMERDLARVKENRREFMKAILDLTKVTPLNKLNLDYRRVMFYVPRKEGVYEMGCDLATMRKIPPRINPDLTAEILSSEDFAQQNDFDETNVYVVTNPSEKIPVMILAVSAMDEFLREAIKEFL